MADLTRYGIAYDDDVSSLLDADVSSVLRASPRLAAILDGWSAGIQRTEDGLWRMITGLGVDTATGQALERIGRVVQEQRLGLADGPYRRVIRAKIRGLLSAGQRQEAIEIFADLVAATSATGRDLEPITASMTVEIDSLHRFVESGLAARSARALEPALQAGIGRDLVVAETGGLILGDIDASGDLLTGPVALDGPGLAHIIDA